MKHALLLCLLLAYGATHAQSVFLTDFRSGDPGTESWSNLGPNASEYGAASIDRGRINAIWVNPTDSNSILAGGDGGGLWKSNDGGNSWRCITDNSATGTSQVIGMQGVNQIAVDPLDTDVIYMAVHMYSQYAKSDEDGLGLVYTTDGGSHWYTDWGFNSIVNTEIPGYGYAVPIIKIGYAPGTSKL